MLTKGDVLKALGKIQNAYGSAEKLMTDHLGPSGKRASEVGWTLPTALQREYTDNQSKATASAGVVAEKEKPLDAAGLRRAILQGLSQASAPARPIIPHSM